MRVCLIDWVSGSAAFRLLSGAGLRTQGLGCTVRMYDGRGIAVASQGEGNATSIIFSCDRHVCVVPSTLKPSSSKDYAQEHRTLADWGNTSFWIDKVPSPCSHGTELFFV